MPPVMLSNHARANPEAVALDDLTRQRSWAELLDRSTRIARLLREEMRLRPDDHAAVLMDNRVEFVELIWGAILAGIWVTPISRHVRAEEIGYIVRDAGAKVLFTDARHEGAARDACAPTTLVIDEALDALLAGASDEPMPLEGPAGATMIYTSGTTGRPKGVRRARPATLGEALTAMARSGATLGLDGTGPHLVTGPLYHAAPLLFAMYDQSNGAPIIIMPRWTEMDTLRLIQERAIRHTHMVPTMLIRLLRLPEEGRRAFDPSSLTLVLHGAAPIAPALKRQMIDWWGPTLVEYWGATESGVCTIVDSPDWLTHPETVGKPLPAFEVFAVNDEGARLPPGDVGTLYCRHKHLAQVFSYHGAPDKTHAAHPEPGLFTLGDVGRVDADGYVYLADRRFNVIISGGVNIYPAEIEQVLQRHAAVADAAVFGIPDDEWGETVKAAVELLEGRMPSDALAADILGFARQHLAGYKVPRSIDFEDQLPRDPSGKLHTRLLRERYWKDRARKI